MTLDDFTNWLHQNASFIEAFSVGVGIQLTAELAGLTIKILRQVKAGTTGGTSE